MSLLQQMVKNEHNIKPPRIVVYGKPGIGKTTFASQSTKPLIIDLEGSADYIDVPKVAPQSYEEVVQLIDALHAEEHDFKTVAIDSADWLETLVHEHICRKHGASSIGDKHKDATSYGKGHILAANMLIEIRNKLDLLRDEKNIAIVITAHSAIKHRDDPLDGDYDEHVLKMHDKFSAALVEWADAVLLIKKKTIESAKSASGRKDIGRIMVASGVLGTTTKNRLNLPDEVPASWSDFINSINTNKGE